MPPIVAVSKIFDVSDSFYGAWNTANTNVATVDYYGTHTGVSVGPTGSNAIAYLPGPAQPRCPLKYQGPGGGVNVTISANLTLQTASFTTQVAGGTATFTAVVTIGAASANQLPVTFTITRGAASNPNNITLNAGSAAASDSCQISTSNSNCHVQFPVSSDANNSHAGAVTWQFTATTTNANYGSSGVATPSPNPLIGTVNFTN